jgi:hypothetical protein
MGISRYTLYKYVKVDGAWRYCKAAYHDNYLADVRKAGEAKKAVADADFVPKPKVVKTGTDGD